jgi:hypothetical protein
MFKRPLRPAILVVVPLVSGLAMSCGWPASGAAPSDGGLSDTAWFPCPLTPPFGSCGAGLDVVPLECVYLPQGLDMM